MEKFSIQRSLDIHYAHRVHEHGGKCAGLHGHRGTVEVLVTGYLEESGPGSGMVIDFSQLDQLLVVLIKENFCHTTILSQRDPWAVKLTEGLLSHVVHEDQAGAVEVFHSGLGTIVTIPCTPTAENLAYLFYRILTYRKLPVTRVRFWETEHSLAVYPA